MKHSRPSNMPDITMGVKVRFHRGAWWVFIDHHGRRRAKKIGDRQTAHDVARAIRQKLAAGDVGIFPAEASVTVREYAKNWLKVNETVWKASTHRFYQFNINLHVVPALGDMPIATVRR